MYGPILFIVAYKSVHILAVRNGCCSMLKYHFIWGKKTCECEGRRVSRQQCSKQSSRRKIEREQLQQKKLCLKKKPKMRENGTIICSVTEIRLFISRVLVCRSERVWQKKFTRWNYLLTGYTLHTYKRPRVLELTAITMLKWNVCEAVEWNQNYEFSYGFWGSDHMECVSTTFSLKCAQHTYWNERLRSHSQTRTHISIRSKSTLIFYFNSNSTQL